MGIIIISKVGHRRRLSAFSSALIPTPCEATRVCHLRQRVRCHHCCPLLLLAFNETCMGQHVPHGHYRLWVLAGTVVAKVRGHQPEQPDHTGVSTRAFVPCICQHIGRVACIQPRPVQHRCGDVPLVLRVQANHCHGRKAPSLETQWTPMLQQHVKRPMHVLHVV